MVITETYISTEPVTIALLWANVTLTTKGVISLISMYGRPSMFRMHYEKIDHKRKTPAAHAYWESVKHQIKIV